jgi:hypothetical protein
MKVVCVMWGSVTDKVNLLKIHQVPGLYDDQQHKAPRYSGDSYFSVLLEKACQIDGLGFDRSAKSMYNFRFSGFRSNYS